MALQRFLDNPKMRWVEHGVAAAGVILALNGAKAAVDKEIDKEATSAVRSMFPEELKDAVTRIPEKGMPGDELIALLEKWRKFDANPHEGRVFSYVYETDQEDFFPVVEKAFTMFMQENGLSPMTFPALRKLEVDVVQMTLNMLNAPTGAGSDACGTMTSGGSESVLLAVKTYRDRARDKFPAITEPEMILPETAHVAFPKAASYFGIKAVYVPVDENFACDVKAVAKAITKNTILLVGSAPQYPHGIVDPIEELSGLAQQHGLPLHVDACFGGFILPWIERLGYKVPKWDFRVPGVTSISADVHKYGYCAKGASVLSFRHAADRRYQFFAFADWPGGLFVSPSILGTRNGGCIASAWAALNLLGEEGYMRLAKKIMDTRDTFMAAINAIPGLAVCGNPVASVVSFRSTDSKVSVLAIADVMEDDFGWRLERQQKPETIHFTINPVHARVIQAVIKDLGAAVEKVLANPDLGKKGTAAMYGMLAKIPDNALIEDFLTSFIGKVYDRDRDDSKQNAA